MHAPADGGGSYANNGLLVTAAGGSIRHHHLHRYLRSHLAPVGGGVAALVYSIRVARAHKFSPHFLLATCCSGVDTRSNRLYDLAEGRDCSGVACANTAARCPAHRGTCVIGSSCLVFFKCCLVVAVHRTV